MFRGKRWKQCVLFAVCLALCGAVLVFERGGVSVWAIDRTWAAPVPLAGSDNFFQVTKHLYRSAQPSKSGMRAYERFGIKTIINLRALHSDVKIYAATLNPNPESVSLLLKAGANVNVRGLNGITALTAAVRNDSPGMAAAVSALIEAGADVNAKMDNDRVGRSATALMLAAWRSSPMIVSILLEAGADAAIKNDDGKRAIDYAEENEKLKGTEAYKQLQEASK